MLQRGERRSGEGAYQTALPEALAAAAPPPPPPPPPSPLLAAAALLTGDLGDDAGSPPLMNLSRSMRVTWRRGAGRDIF